jgi:predicted TIM-barrel enzyme
MGKTFTRQEITDRLRGTIAEGKPIIGAGSSCGLIAKCAELGGADFIVVYSTGKSRLMGLPTTRAGDNNGLTLEMAPEILWVAKDTPVLGGCEANDPFRMDHERLLKLFLDAGFHGIIPFPTVAMWEHYRQARDKVGLGFEREVDLVRLAHEWDIFTMVYAHHPEDAKALVQAGADLVCAHAGPTTGGLTGYRYDDPVEAACAGVQAIIEAARSVRSDVICVAHGGPFATPQDTLQLYRMTDTQGFIGASTVERIPVERAVKAVVEEYKQIPMGK